MHEGVPRLSQRYPCDDAAVRLGAKRGQQAVAALLRAREEQIRMVARADMQGAFAKLQPIERVLQRHNTRQRLRIGLLTRELPQHIDIADLASRTAHDCHRRAGELLVAENRLRIER